MTLPSLIRSKEERLRASQARAHRDLRPDAHIQKIYEKTFSWASRRLAASGRPGASRRANRGASRAATYGCIFRKCIFRKFCKFLAGSFSAVSKRNFARKQNMRSTAFFKLYKICILLHRCNLNIFVKNRFEKSAIFVQIQQKFCKCRKICKMLPNFKKFS